MIRLTDKPFDPAAELTAFTARANGAGAIVSFTGLVRPEDAGDEAVTRLHLQAYEPLTSRGMEDAARLTESRWPLSALTVIHRTGDMVPGDPIVFVAAGAAHRRPAFEAADFLMDYLKTNAVFWKKETGPNGARWIEPRTADYQDAARWAAPTES